MFRAVPLRLTVGLALLLIAGGLSTECGGNDVIDSADSSTDGSFDSGPVDAAMDSMLADSSPEEADGSFDSGPVDAADGATDSMLAESGLADAGPDAGDASLDAADSGFEGGGLAAPALHSAKTFAVLASSTITNIGVTTAIVGDVGISPGTALVNLPSGQVSGTIHLGDAVAAQAQSDVATAYNDLVGRPCQHVMSSVDLGGTTLAPGVYCFAIAAAQMVGNLTLDAQGDPNAVWIFQIGSTLTIATNVSTNMINQGNACNVYWQVGSSATINTGAGFKGNILAKASITLLTGANVSPGRTFAQTAAVTLDSNGISNAGCP
jgi:hypothetical protein